MLTLIKKVIQSLTSGCSLCTLFIFNTVISKVFFSMNASLVVLSLIVIFFKYQFSLNAFIKLIFYFK